MIFTMQTTGKRILPPIRSGRIRNLKAIYAFMKSKADADGTLIVKQCEIVDATGLSLRTVKRHTAALQFFGQIEVLSKTRKGTTYKLKI